MGWCEEEEPRGISPARHGKCGGTPQLKPPTEQIICPNPVTFTYLIVLFVWLVYHLMERVCTAGRGVLFIVAASLVNLCSFLAGFEWCLISRYKQQPFGRCMGGCVSKEFLLWKSEFLIGLIAQHHNLWLVSGSTKLCFRIYLQVIVHVRVQYWAKNHVLLIVLSFCKGYLKPGA